jgi:hypothetical protein
MMSQSQYRKWDLLEKGKVAAREEQWSPEASGSLLWEGWGFYGHFNSGFA